MSSQNNSDTQEYIALLEQRLNSLDSVIDILSGNHWWKDTKGRYLGCNKNVANRIGLEPSDIIGKTDYELPWKEQADELVRNDKIVMEQGITITQEEPVANTSGEVLIFLVTKAPLKDSNGKIIFQCRISRRILS